MPPPFWLSLLYFNLLVLVFPSEIPAYFSALGEPKKVTPPTFLLFFCMRIAILSTGHALLTILTMASFT